MQDYWALRSFTKHGARASIAAGLLFPLVAGLVMLASAWSWALFAAALIAGAAFGYFVKIFAELAQVIVEMLLPSQD